MSLDMFKAYTQGYSDRLFDLQILSVQSGYWAAYYSNAKHPKSLNSLITEMTRRKNETEQKSSKNVVKPEVDVEAFLELERRFRDKLLND